MRQYVLNPQMFTSCFAPIPNCGSMTSRDEVFHRRRESKPRRNKPRKLKQEAMTRMEGPVRKVLAAAMIRRNESLITRDDETATLMTDVRLQRERSEGSSGTEPSTDSSADYSSSSETRDLNTIAEDAEKNFLRAKAMIARMVKRPFGVTNTSSYAESTTCSSNGGVDSNKFASIRSKFDHLRKKKQFSDPGDDPPCDQSIATFKSLKADDAMSFMKKGFQHKRKNELAKQILQRRSQMQMASRTGFDP